MAVALVYVVFFAENSALYSPGYVVYTEWSGMTILTVIVLTCNIRVMLLSNQLSILLATLCFLGCLGYFLVFYIFTILPNTSYNSMLWRMVGSIEWWLVVGMLVWAIEGTYFIIQK